MKRSLAWLLGLLTHHFGWKLLSLSVAVLIWVLVASDPELSTFSNVPLEYRNLPESLEVSSSLIESVYLELRGPSSELRGLGDMRRPAVVLDMSAAHPGERTYAIGNGNVRLPRGVKLVRAVPSQVRFRFEARSFRDVPVRVRFAPERAAEVASFRVSPPTLRILGPESHVARIAAAETDTLDLSGVRGTAELRGNAFLEDSYVRFESPPAIVVSVTMKSR